MRVEKPIFVTDRFAGKFAKQYVFAKSGFMSAHDTSDTIRDIASYYSARLAEHGATPRGVDWNGQASQDVRHAQFLRLLDAKPDGSVIDLGCGYGDFLRFLRAQGSVAPYTGYDVAPSMIDAAKQLHGESADCNWKVGARPEKSADFAIASGIFNVKGTVDTHTWADHVYETIDILAAASRSGFAFNILSLASDPERRREDLFYADPVDTLRHCIAHYGRSVALLQDYGLYEFTMIVRRT